MWLVATKAREFLQLRNICHLLVSTVIHIIERDTSYAPDSLEERHERPCMFSLGTKSNSDSAKQGVCPTGNCWECKPSTCCLQRQPNVDQFRHSAEFFYLQSGSKNNSLFVSERCKKGNLTENLSTCFHRIVCVPKMCFVHTNLGVLQQRFRKKSNRMKGSHACSVSSPTAEQPRVNNLLRRSALCLWQKFLFEQLLWVKETCFLLVMQSRVGEFIYLWRTTGNFAKWPFWTNFPEFGVRKKIL